jgi:glyoxylase-like metal-dependent hydrolase (beta-lactamase superfamily II)
MLIRTAVLCVCLALAAPVLAQAPPDPVVHEETLQKLTEHVWVIPDASVPLVPNVGIVVGTAATLVIDTGLGPRNGEAVMRAVEQVSPEDNALYIVTTHVHPEHDLGASAFPATARMIRSRDQEKDIAEFGLTLAEAFARRSPATADLLRGAQYRKADIVFDSGRDIDLGGVVAHIIAMGPNHTRGDTVVRVESDRVLFTGDVAMKAQPSFASPYSSLDHWLESLTRLNAMAPWRIVPSHGPIGGIEYVAGYRRYLTVIRDRTRALKAEGKSADQAVRLLTAELRGQYPDANRLGGAVRAAYGK